MKRIQWIGFSLLLLSVIGLSIFVINRPVVYRDKPVLNNSANVEEIIKRHKDSLDAVYIKKYNDLESEKAGLKKQVIYIYKNISNENNIIDRANANKYDSLWTKAGF